MSEFEAFVEPVDGHVVINRNSKFYSLTQSAYDNAMLEGKIEPLTIEQMNEHKKQPYVPRAVKKVSMVYPKSTGRNDRYGKMTEIQKKHFISAVNAGSFTSVACDETGVTWDVYMQTCKDDPRFKRDVINGLRFALGKLDTRIRKGGLSDDASLADAIAARRLAIDVEMKSAHIRYKNREIKALERNADTNKKLADHVTAKPNFSNLETLDEVEEYSSLYAKIRSCVELTVDEKTRFGELSAKVLRTQSTQRALAGPTDKQDFESRFDDYINDGLDE